MGDYPGRPTRKLPLARGRQQWVQAVALGLWALLAACSHQTLPGTRIRDTAGNRQIFTMLEETLTLAKEVHLSLEIYDIVVQGDYAFADVRYASRARLELPAGRLWDSHRDFNRLEFVRESGAWKVISGL